MTYTADRLTFDMNPPAYFGMVEFAGGGRAMVDFTEVVHGSFEVGTQVSDAVSHQVPGFKSRLPNLFLESGAGVAGDRLKL